MVAPPVKSGYVSNGPGLQLNYLEWGDPEAPPVVLIIGLTGAAYNWRTTAEALQDRYRLLAINIRAHGDSGPSLDRTPNKAGDTRWYDWASDVDALITELELDRPVVMGHSLGARVAYCHAAYFPENLRSVIVVDNGPGFPPHVAQRVQENYMRKTPTEFASLDGARNWMKTRIKTSPGSAAAVPVPDEEWESRVAYHFRRLPDGRVVFKHDPLLRDEWLEKLPFRSTMESWLWKEIAQVQCPMLLIVGELSQFQTPETCEKMVELTCGPARWAPIKNAGHLLMEDNLRGFLDEVEPFLEQSFAS